RRRRPRPHRRPPQPAAQAAVARSRPPCPRIRARAGTQTRSARGACGQPPRVRWGTASGERDGDLRARCWQPFARAPEPRTSPLLSQPVARQTAEEPWRALLATGRDDGRLVSEACEGPGRATLCDPPDELHPEVLAALSRMGVQRLYSHQAQAPRAVWQGTTIVTTGTASGKSMCFNLPTLDVLCREPRARAL